MYIFGSLEKCCEHLSNLYNDTFNKKIIRNVCGGYKKSYKGFVLKYASQ